MIQAAALPALDVSAPTASGAPTRTAANGVRHWEKGSLPEIAERGDVYELPAGRAGVPQRVTVVPRRWWGGGGRLEAVDVQGHPLKVKTWDGTIYVTDAATKTTTTIDRDSLRVTVSSELQSKTRPMLCGCRTFMQRKLEETLEPTGDVRIRANYDAVEERVNYGMVREMPATQTMTVALDEKYEQALIPKDGSPSAATITKQRHQDPVEKEPLACHIDQSGDLTVTRADGGEETFRLFIPPHAISGR